VGMLMLRNRIIPLVGDARVIVNHGAAAKPSSADMVQENRQFQPKSLIVARVSQVNFPNRDTTQHHVYSFSPAKVFNLELSADQPDASILFEKTEASGMATISLPADTASSGELSLSLWHPSVKKLGAWMLL